MIILVTGANGQLGQSLKKLASKLGGYDFHFTDLEELDIQNERDVLAYISSLKPNYVINTAAYTAVDAAEDHEKLARLVNAQAVGFLADACNENSARLIHLSTDYVFDGTQHCPYIEEDEPNPSSVYGQTKLEGENLALFYEHALVIRTSWLYSEYGKNFVKTMLSLSESRNALNVVFDQIGTPTFAGDLAEAILHIIQSIENEHRSFVPGIYHYSNEGVTSWYDFAVAIFKHAHKDCTVSPITSDAYPTVAKRPHYSVLNKQKIKTIYDVSIPHWEDALKRCLVELVKK